MPGMPERNIVAIKTTKGMNVHVFRCTIQVHIIIIIIYIEGSN